METFYKAYPNSPVKKVGDFTVEERAYYSKPASWFVGYQFNFKMG